MLLAARLTAISISLGTFAFLFIGGAWRADNLFLVPDLILCALLALAACWRGSGTPGLMLLAFGFTAGVLSCSVADYAVRGEVGFASLLGAIAASAMGLILWRAQGRTRVTARP